MSNEENSLLIITPEEEGQRLDKVLADRYKGTFSRSYFQYLIEDHSVLVDGLPIKKRMKLKAGDEVEVQFILTPEVDLIAEDIPLDIVYEDQDILVINKPVGMVVHPAPGNWTGTFVNALMFHCQMPAFEEKENHLRPGIVHRLDKETSGLLVAAKTRVAHQRMIELFASREVKKEYLAICLGNPGQGLIEAPIGRHPLIRKKMAVVEEGKPAKTRYLTLKHNSRLSLVRLFPETGRTHQIRVHMKHHGTPILGDSLYGNSQANKKFHVERQLLHAARLQFLHPTTQKPLDFEVPLPPDMMSFLAANSTPPKPKIDDPQDRPSDDLDL